MITIRCGHDDILSVHAFAIVMSCYVIDHRERKRALAIKLLSRKLTLVSHSKCLENVFHPVDDYDEDDDDDGDASHQFEFFKAICVKPCRMSYMFFAIMLERQ